MSSVLSTVGRWAFRARGLVVSLAVGVLLLLLVVAGAVGTGTDNTYRIPGTESQEALDALGRTFPQFSGASAQLIAVAPPGGDVTDQAFEQAVGASVDHLTTIPQVAGASSPYGSSSSANIAPDHSAVLVPIQLTVGTTQVEPSTSQALQDAGAALEHTLPPGSQVSVGGQLFSQGSAGISATELVGLLVAFGVLVLTFAALAAAAMPLVTALTGAGISLAIVFAATRFVTVTSTAPLLALMLGLAVGIDYALFILSRHQDQLKHGVEPEESAARAIGTAGSAVVFAATTVIIALLGLAVAGIPFLTTMGVAAALAVAVAVVVSTTLLPALLGFAGWRVVPRRYRPAPAEDEDEDEPAPAADDAAPEDVPPDEERRDGEPAVDAPVAEQPPHGVAVRWVHAVTRWPAVTVVLVIVVLGLAALPASALRLALPDAGSLEEGSPARVTYDLVAQHFGPGWNGPLVLTGSVIQSADPVGVVDKIAAEVAKVPGVASVPLATPNATGDTAVIQAIPQGRPDSKATEDLVARLRAMHDHFETTYGVSLSVTGYTAAGIDISARLGAALAPFALLIVGLSLVLLAIVFRSLVVPVTAALGYLLSVAAAFGLTALVFVDGHLADALHVAGVGSVVSFMPIILMGVLFGLAMDYEVFLVSRMREDYVHHGEPRAAIERGFVASARVVTAAAVIMVAVFAAFIPEGDANIQPIAFGLAVGVAIDAFVVRMTLVPAVLALCGRGAWWLPARLDRALPRFDVEGEELARELELADWPSVPVPLVADGLRVPGGPAEPVDVVAEAGALTVLRGGTAAERRALLLALGGRAASEGRVKLDGLLLPGRGGAARRRSAYVRLDPRGDPAAAVRAAAGPRVVVLLVDGADDVVEPAARVAVQRALAEALADGRRSVVVACRAESVLDGLVPLAVPTGRVDLPPAAPAVRETAVV